MLTGVTDCEASLFVAWFKLLAANDSGEEGEFRTKARTIVLSSSQIHATHFYCHHTLG